jgi:hypothetical protein
MSFKITRAIGVIGLLSFVLWLSIQALSSVETECQVEYYGTPDFRALADNILDMQASSYHYNDNYHRALRSQECLNTRFDCDVIDKIDYLGGKLVDNEITREQALDNIQYQIEEIYERNGLAELRVTWSLPIVEVVDYDYPSPDYVAYSKCTATFEVSNDGNYEIGESIICFTPSIGSECRVELERHLNLDSVASFTAYVTGFCLVVVSLVTIIAISARCRKRMRRRRDAIYSRMDETSDESEDEVYEEDNELNKEE